MHNIFKSKKTIVFSVVFSSLIALASCSSYENDTSMGKRKAESRGTVTDKVLYYPRKTSNWFSNFWDKHVKGVPPDWQRYMDLGQPRKPVYNPGGQMYMNQPGEPVIMPQDKHMYGEPGQIPSQPNYGEVPVQQRPMPDGYAAPEGNYGVYNEPPYNQPAYVPPPSMAPVEQPQYTPLMPSPVGSASQGDEMGQSLPWQQPDTSYQSEPIPLSPQSGGGEKEQYYEGDVDIRQNGFVPAPLAPWERDPNYTGAGASGSQEYKPVYQGDSYEPSSMQSPYDEDLSNVGGTVDPYEPGGFEKGFNPPSYDELEKMGGDPFAPMQHKYIRVFEPVAAEYYYDENGNVVSKEQQSGFVPVPVVKKKSPRRSVSKNMFPIEEYAPKSSVGVNNYFSSPQQQGFVSSANKEKVNSRIDELIIKLGEETALVTLDAENNGAKIEKEQKTDENAVNADAVKTVKVPGTPQELSEEEKPFVIPKVKESELAEITPSKKDLYDPKPVELVMPGQTPVVPLEDEKVAEKEVVQQAVEKEVVEKAAENDIKKEAAVNERRLFREVPSGNLPWLAESEKTEVKQVVESPSNIDEEFEKIKLGLLPIAHEKVQVKPINTAEIAFPVNNPVEDEFSPIDLAPPVQKVGSVRVEKPLLDVPEISEVTEAQPQFFEENLAQKQYYIQENVPQQAEQDNTVTQNAPFYEEQQQIVVVTPAKNEYVAPPIVNIRKQFEEYRKENRSSSYSILRGSRYSDRRNAD
ncbi:MAG: hypothetical protein COV35_07490 [Alphaproteobacteria bacterium CG11_big_fil_rev_8_21_14_0_20_39_49]|nr:MAG: hypothetical protein COV35_07490 [Alphaproteobacteria bacterium CG11_big_fil_rev_8_21_14_0_20_39_49]